VGILVYNLCSFFRSMLAVASKVSWSTIRLVVALDQASQHVWWNVFLSTTAKNQSSSSQCTPHLRSPPQLWSRTTPYWQLISPSITPIALSWLIMRLFTKSARRTWTWNDLPTLT